MTATLNPAQGTPEIMLSYPQNSDYSHQLQRREENALTMASGGIVCSLVGGALVLIIGGGLISWTLSVLGALMVVGGLVNHSIARRARRKSQQR